MINNKNIIMNNSNNPFFNSLYLMKVIACFAVIVIHSCIFNINSINGEWWALNLFNSFSRFAVPMFIMISGALLINNKYSLSYFLKKRAARIIPPLIFWSVIYLIWLGDSRLLSLNVIKTIIAGPVYYHLWYLYSMIGVLLFSPIISAAYLNSTKETKTYFLVMWAIIYSLYPVARQFFDMQFDLLNVYELYSFFGLIGWYFLGAFLRDHITGKNETQKSITPLFIFIASSLSIAILTYSYSSSMGVITKDVGITSPLFFERNSPLIIISTVSLFIYLSNIRLNPEGKTFKLTKIISSFSLGIYCLHLMILRELLDPITNLFQNRWLSVPALAITVSILCFVIIYPLRKIKITKYIL